ncbi:MAG: helix-turn-helix domain-containing protein [Microthrixaceae bacterium]|jgi:transcriptional regulator with XRE-family HTH domain|nr:helix-turn-helix domain-containing protein [Microthrixaceae bacterium]
MSTASTSALLASLPSRPGDLIRERRMELGLTQAELSELAGIAQGDISKIENGHLDARWSTVKRLSDALESVREPKASLANGGYRRTKQTSAGDRWQPSGKAKHTVTRSK